MDAGNVVATTLSSLALLVSAATLYLTYFRKKAALVGCLAAMSAPEVDDVDNWSFEFALSNTGNIELLVREVALEPPKIGLVPEITPEALPAILKPGEVQLLTLELPNRFCRQPAQIQHGVTFTFHVFSSRGTVYAPRKALGPLREVGGTTKADWVPFTLGGAMH